MRKLLLSAAAMTLLFTACKKDDDGPSGLGQNQWMVGGTTYSAVASGVTVTGSMMSGTGTNGSADASGLIVSFGDVLPTTNGTYKIVDMADDANEIDITVSQANAGGSKIYDSKATGNADATVTVNGGKVTVSIPQITVAGALGTTGETTFSGNLVQP